MAYQLTASTDSYKDLTSTEEGDKFFTPRNQIRAVTLLVASLLAGAFVIRSDSFAAGKGITFFKSTNDKPVQELKNVRSDSRLSPIFMSRYTEEKDLFHTFFSKYGLVGNRKTNSKKYTPTKVKSNSVKTAADKTWAYATITEGETCTGDVVSIGAITTQECFPISGYGSDDSNSFMLDCTEGGDIVINAYESADCSGSKVLSSSVLAPVDTCYSYSSTLFNNPDDVEFAAATTSEAVIFKCAGASDLPALSKFDVQKTFITVDADTSAVCSASVSSELDGQMFEAFPVGTCTPQSLGDSEYSLNFNRDDSNNVVVNYYFKSTDCSSDSVSQTLSSECASEDVQTGVDVYSKWVYRE